MPLTKYGVREWGVATVVCVAISIVALVVLDMWWILIPTWLIWLAIAAFFRDPIRRVRVDLPRSVMVSPADGTISAVQQYDSHEATGGEPAICVRIFLSLLNVHVNRSPADATVVEKIYRPGKFLDARTEESAQVNESNLLILERDRGDGQNERFGVRQVSGKVARRIVDATTNGSTYRRGQHIGMIKFGSTTELILPRPDEVRVFVKVGDKVRGGLTQLAEIADVQAD
jgi:phosphatidylserine decarboxylase